MLHPASMDPSVTTFKPRESATAFNAYPPIRHGFKCPEKYFVLILYWK